ncbi:unnamed protein product [Discosporangium mesarthrocarpum]
MMTTIRGRCNTYLLVLEEHRSRYLIILPLGGVRVGMIPYSTAVEGESTHLYLAQPSMPSTLDLGMAVKYSAVTERIFCTHYCKAPKNRHCCRVPDAISAQVVPPCGVLSPT